MILKLAFSGLIIIFYVYENESFTTRTLYNERRKTADLRHIQQLMTAPTSYGILAQAPDRKIITKTFNRYCQCLSAPLQRQLIISIVSIRKGYIAITLTVNKEHFVYYNFN